MLIFGSTRRNWHWYRIKGETFSSTLWKAVLLVYCAQAAVDGFLEEMIIRRELADNFCFYEPNYDNIKCAAPWAMESLNKHRHDKREHLYNE
jgi:deoxyribodipyrimidine photolyase